MEKMKPEWARQLYCFNNDILALWLILHDEEWIGLDEEDMQCMELQLVGEYLEANQAQEAKL